MTARRRRRRPFRLRSSNGLTDPVTRLWLWRTLAAVGIKRLAPRNLEHLDDAVLDACGLLGTKDLEKVSAATAERKLRARILAANVSARRGALHQNLARLQRLLSLDDVERDLVGYLVRLKTCTPFSNLLSEVNEPAAIERVIAAALDVNAGRVHAAMRPESTLRAAGLLRPRAYVDTVDHPLDLLDGLTMSLLSRHASDGSLLRGFFRRAPAPTLSLSSFAHLGDGLDVAVALIDAVKVIGTGKGDAGRRGINVLLHGAPGNGKSELARALAKASKHMLFEVGTEDAHGKPAGRDDRLSSWQLCQRVVQHVDDAMIVFDEAEDAFPAGGSFFGFSLSGASPANKGWVNQMLETSKTPTVWITNAADAIDAAFLRRFDLVLEVRPPREAARRALDEHAVKGLALSTAVKDELALDDRISPALVERAARVARATSAAPSSASSSSSSSSAADRAVRAVTRGFLDVVSPAGRPRRRRPPFAVDLTLLNTTPDTASVVDEVLARREASILLHGLPGTGKTELCRAIAEQAGVPLVARRASELLGMYVGQTEKNLAAMFREARDRDAFLLLDEADTFLRDRAGARASWEVSQVNELLVQMESFEGVFFCCTNLVDDLDAAAFRRFDLKVRCDPLTRSQRARVCADVFGGSVFVDDLDGLCLGDVASVARGLKLAKNVDASEVARRLKDELARRRQRPRIGFAG